MYLYTISMVVLVAKETFSKSSYENHLKRNWTIARFPIKLLYNTNCHRNIEHNNFF